MRNNARNLFVAVFVTAFSQNVFAADEVMPADPDEKKSGASAQPAAEPPKPADCASKPTDEEKAACVKQAADAVKAAQAKADEKPADKPTKPKKVSPQPKCPSAEEWQKLLVGKDKEIGELKAKVAELTKARDEFEAKVKKTEAELAGAKEEIVAVTAVANAAIAERDRATSDAAEARWGTVNVERALGSALEALKSEQHLQADAEKRASAAEMRAMAAETALVAAKGAPAPPAGGQPAEPPKPAAEVPEDIRPCVERLVAFRFHRGGEAEAIKRCNERIIALRSGR